MKKWQQGSVEANGLSIHYYRTGGNLPQVVLNHGVLDDGLCWTRVAGALEADYDVILPDARGHGMSDHGSGDYSSAARAADLIGVIQALGLEKPVIGGHSLGADSSLHTAIQRPDLIAGFFMEDPPITFPGEPLFGGPFSENPDDYFKMMMPLLKLVKQAPGVMGRAMAKRISPSSTPDEIEAWLDAKKRVSADLIEAFKQPSWLMGNFDFDLLDKVSTPAMLIYGERDAGAIVSQAAAEQVQQRIAGLRLAHIAGANHDIRRVRFEDYLEVLKQFLDEVWGEKKGMTLIS